MHLVWVLFSCALAHVVCSSDEDLILSRSLYDLNLPDKKVINVSTTYVGISQPVGIERGVFNGATGIFVSSFMTNKIHFIETSNGCEDTRTCTLKNVAGSGASGILNGPFGSATISDPSRMLYLSSLNVLMVTDRGNGLIRYLDFATSTMKTVVTPTGSSITLLGSAVSDSNPELDIKMYGKHFYLSDSRSVYNLTGSDGTLAGALTGGVLTRYSALKTWQLANGYDISQHKIFIESIAVNSKTNMLYVAYTYERSAIVEVPLQCTSSSQIRVLASDNVVYDIPKTYPKPRNGMLNSVAIASFALVTFPMHMVYVAADDTLYWVEVYSHMSDNKLGAVAVRRLRFTNTGTGLNGCSCAELSCNCGEVDYYAGDVGTFRSYLGRAIGFKDGYSNVAQFRVPLTISVSSDSVGPVIYVVDSENSAIRKVRTKVDTPNPTAAPTISHAPSHAPTVSHSPSRCPTTQPTPAPSVPPTRAPTAQPTRVPSPHPVTASPSSSAPSVAPISSAPTLAPSPVPSARPTHSPTHSHAPTEALAPSTAPTVEVHAPTAAPTSLDGECLDIVLMDEFGDGWLGAALSVNHSGFYQDLAAKHARPKPPPSVHRTAHPSDPNAFTSSELHSVTSTNNPVRFSICASLSEDRFFERGLYTLEVQSVTGAKIPNEWEMRWQVEMSNGDTYPGSSKTSMTFDFTSEGVFSLVRSRAMLKELDSCRRCDHPSKPPPPARAIPFVLHSKSGSGWLSSTSGSIGTKYSISDSSKTKLVNSGSICDKTLKENCEVKLADGDYYFRVGGAGDENRGEVAWTFCKVHASAQNELSFSVVGGECMPGALQHAADMSESIETTSVTMKGELLIENVFEDELSVASTEVLEAAIAESLKINAEDVAVVYVCKTSTGDGVFCSKQWGVSSSSSSSSSSRELMIAQGGSGAARQLSETFSFNVVYLITFIAEKYEVVGTRYQDVLQVSEMLASSLSEQFRSGLLEVAARGLAGVSSEAQALSYVRIVQFVPPVETDLSYKFKAPSQSKPVGLTDSFGSAAAEVLVIDESLEQESLLFIPLAIVIVAVALVVAVTRQGSAQAETSSWRNAVFGSSRQRTEDSKEAEEATRPFCSNYRDRSHDLPTLEGDRVDFDSMFGSRGHGAGGGLDSGGGLLSDPGAGLNAKKQRANRYVQRDEVTPQPEVAQVVDLWGESEVCSASVR